MFSYQGFTDIFQVQGVVRKCIFQENCQGFFFVWCGHTVEDFRPKGAYSFYTVNSENLFLRIALKDIFTTLKFSTKYQ